jgi:serine-type D-Ala-D-Ala carboxypeptidase/endopeptidase (penicillin-binding protein 4)
MKKYLLSATSLMLLLFWPIQAQEIAIPVEPKVLSPERFNTISETNYLTTLALRGFNLDTQGLFIESLDGSMVFADHHSDIAFNPASVIKLGTTAAALAQLGPDYKFETAFLTNGAINKKTKSLQGDLILRSTGDPQLTSAELTRLIRQVIKAGVSRVSGNVVVTGPLSFANYYTTDRAVKRLAVVLRSIGIAVKGSVKRGTADGGTLVASHTSKSLREILFFQNSYSSNPVAERLGEAIGGPKSVESFLINTVGIPAADVVVGRTSGLDYNRITPKGTVALLRHLYSALEKNNMNPHDIMPMAGVDVGTLQRRFTTVDYRGAIIGKTGTLPGTDGGVSTLAGLAFTRDRGPVLFAIFNTRGSVITYRRLQDELLKDLIVEFGGVPEINASSRRSNN